MDLIKFKVTGLVQGVCFRYYTQQEAAKLGVRGWCHNHPDESVEGAAAGPADAIEKFKAFLWRGPPSAKVKNVELEETKDASEEQVKKVIGPDTSFYVRKFKG